MPFRLTSVLEVVVNLLEVVRPLPRGTQQQVLPPLLVLMAPLRLPRVALGKEAGMDPLPLAVMELMLGLGLQPRQRAHQSIGQGPWALLEVTTSPRLLLLEAPRL